MTTVERKAKDGTAFRRFYDPRNRTDEDIATMHVMACDAVDREVALHNSGLLLLCGGKSECNTTDLPVRFGDKK